MSRRRIPKGAARRIARERMERLFELTEQEMKSGRSDRARRYVELAVRIGMRYNVSANRWKRRFCPVCNSYYMFPSSASVRLNRRRIIIKCLNCGHISRYPYKR